MATILRHGSFVFFIYVCVASLMYLLGSLESGLPVALTSLLLVSFEVLVGAGVTILFIDRLNDYRDQENLKRRLIREAGSRSHDIAISAVEWMDREGWLGGEDGLLKGANLREARLQDARMDGANLEGTVLESADLRRVRLIKATMNKANLFMSNLQGARMTEAQLNGAKLSVADLTGAFLSYATLHDAELHEAVLKSADLHGSDFRDTNLVGADLQCANLWEANFHKANMQDAKLKEARSINYANFQGANLCFVDFKGVDLSKMDLSDVQLQCADLRNTRLFGTNLQNADLRGSYLEGAKLSLKSTRIGTHPEHSSDANSARATVLPGTVLMGAKLPDGKVFTEDMGFEDIAPYVDTSHERYDATLKAIEEGHPARRRNRKSGGR